MFDERTHRAPIRKRSSSLGPNNANGRKTNLRGAPPRLNPTYGHPHPSPGHSNEHTPIPIHRRPLVPRLLRFAHDVQESTPRDQPGHPAGKQLEEQAVHFLRPGFGCWFRISSGMQMKSRGSHFQMSWGEINTRRKTQFHIQPSSNRKKTLVCTAFPAS